MSQVSSDRDSAAGPMSTFMPQNIDAHPMEFTPLARRPKKTPASDRYLSGRLRSQCLSYPSLSCPSLSSQSLSSQSLHGRHLSG